MADGLGFLTLAGRKIAYVDSGAVESPKTTPTVLLLHGFGASLEFWRHAAEDLSDHYRVVALDLPGFGRSDSPADFSIDAQLPVLAGFLDALGIERCHVVGHSMGTLVACEFTAAHPERVDRVVLASGPITSVLSLLKRPVRTLLKRPQVATFYVEAISAGKPVPPKTREAVLAKKSMRWTALRAFAPNPWELAEADVSVLLDAAGAPGAAPTLRQGKTYRPDAAYRELSRPVWLIGGTRDTICPPADLREFSAAHTFVKGIHLIDGVGHLPMFEAREEFNATLRSFLG
ncbi:MAG TPA: alpha/beta hydrolase [Aeromicrobium sp.]|nr:alpha/beta hydrolase [Aeromicrobium sp.]